MYYKNSEYLAFINVSLIEHMSSETYEMIWWRTTNALCFTVELRNALSLSHNHSIIRLWEASI